MIFEWWLKCVLWVKSLKIFFFFLQTCCCMTSCCLPSNSTWMQISSNVSVLLLCSTETPPTVRPIPPPMERLVELANNMMCFVIFVNEKIFWINKEDGRQYGATACSSHFTAVWYEHCIQLSHIIYMFLRVFSHSDPSEMNHRPQTTLPRFASSPCCSSLNLYIVNTTHSWFACVDSGAGKTTKEEERSTLSHPPLPCNVWIQLYCLRL